MPEAFDPYHKWLGIPPKDQPPNLYRLLGIDLFESDPDVISGAADQRMAHVRSMQSGKNAALSQKILNEISAARVCLLQPARKAKYDGQLRRRLEPTAPKAAIPTAQAVPPSTASQAPATPLKAEPTPAAISIRPTAPRRGTTSQRNNTKPVVLGLAILLLAVLLAAWALNRSGPEVASVPPPSKPTPSQPTRKADTPPAPSLARKSDRLPEKQKQLDALPPKNPPEAPVAHPETKPPEPAEQPPPNPKPLLPDSAVPRPESEPRQPEPPPSQEATEPLPKDTPGDAKPRRAPVPNDKTLRPVLAMLRETFRDQYANPTEAFPKELLNRSQEEEDLVARFAMLQEAWTLAAEAGDEPTALEAIAETSRLYQIDASALKATVLGKFARIAKTPAQRRQLVDKALAVIAEAVAADDFDTAEQLGRLAVAQARSTRDAALTRKVMVRNREVKVAAKLFAAVEVAMTTLDKTPDDPEASTVAGKYYCFRRGNWQKGLPLLATGDDETLKALASGEIEGKTPLERLADGWWAVSEEESAKEHLREHAADLYEKALPELSGVVRLKAQERIRTATEGKWIVLFRSANPSIWNSDVPEGESGFAIPLDRALPGIQFLRFRRCDNGDYVIIPMNNDRLGKRTVSGTFGWNGACEHLPNHRAYNLGVYHTVWDKDHRGKINVFENEGIVAYAGWGFGKRNFFSDRQGYAWANQEIPPTVLEVAVKTGALQPDETKHLLGK